MKSGRSLPKLAQELKRRSEAKHDYDVNTPALVMDPQTSTIHLPADHGVVTPTDHAHRQMASRLQIPWKYYQRLHTTPDGSLERNLLANNVNHWFTNQPEQRLVRTLDGNMRAFLSSGYLTLDNWDLAQVVADEITSMDAIVKSCEVTDNRLYLQIVTPKLQGEIRLNDPVQAGLVVSNSEIGLGQFQVEPMLYRLVCTNGMISPDASFKRRHIGRRMEGLGEDGEQILKDSTKRAIDKSFWMTVRDVVHHAVSEVGFDKLRTKFVESTEVQIKADPIDLVERVKTNYQLTDGEGTSVLKNLLIGNDMTKYGLINAVTAVANQEDINYDRAVEMERLGGTIMDEPKSIWEKLDATD